MNNLFLLNICIILLYFVINVNGDPIIANNKYCTHFKDKLGKSYLELDPDEISKLKNIQYLLPIDEFDKIPDNAKLDYFIRYSVISEGLCYFHDGFADSEEETNNYGFATKNNVSIEEQIRYEKTVNCFYYYHKYGTPQTKQILYSQGLCHKYFHEYMNGLKNFFDNNNKCLYPDFDSMKTPIDKLPDYSTIDFQNKIDDIYNLRVTYFNDLAGYIHDLKMENCIDNDRYNQEWTNCGYRTEDLKREYCENNPTNEDRDGCCASQHNSRKKLAEFDTKKESIITGVASATVILIIGSYFSAKYINDIIIQDNMKKSIRNQEKEYNESHKQMMREAYNQGYDVNKQIYNSRSRNLNSGTLRNTKPNTGTLRSTAGSAVSLARSNVSQARSAVSQARSTVSQAKSAVSLARYPPNTFSIAQDYQANDSQDISLRKGMVVQLVQQYEGGWVMVRDLKSNRQGYAPEYCLGNKLA